MTGGGEVGRATGVRVATTEDVGEGTAVEVATVCVGTERTGFASGGRLAVPVAVATDRDEWIFD